MTQHTPTPWKYDGNGFDSIAAKDFGTDGYTVMGDDCEPICEMIDMLDDELAKANADFIVKACNHHDELVRVLVELADALKPEITQNCPKTKRAYDEARAVLEKVES